MFKAGRYLSLECYKGEVLLVYDVPLSSIKSFNRQLILCLLDAVAAVWLMLPCCILRIISFNCLCMIIDLCLLLLM